MTTDILPRSVRERRSETGIQPARQHGRRRAEGKPRTTLVPQPSGQRRKALRFVSYDSLIHQVARTARLRWRELAETHKGALIPGQRSDR